MWLAFSASAVFEYCLDTHNAHRAQDTIICTSLAIVWPLLLEEQNNKLDLTARVKELKRCDWPRGWRDLAGHARRAADVALIAYLSTCVVNVTFCLKIGSFTFCRHHN